MKQNRLWMLAAILLLTGAVCAQTTIITAGVVETATGQNGDATAVVLQNGKIAYVGSDEGAMAYHSGNAEIIDAAGNTIMPTMTEAHIHMYTALMTKYEISLNYVTDVSEMQVIIKRIASLRPAYTVEQCKAALKEQQQWLASLGFTSAFDAGVVNTSEGTEANMYQALSEMASDKELKMKVRGSFWVLPYDFKDWDECKAYLDGWMQKIAQMGGDDYYSVTTIKMMADQVLEEGTAYLSEGMYADGVLKDGDIESNNIWAGKEDMMEKVFEYAGEHGLNLHIHQIGDAAATLVLDQLEKAVEVYPNLKNQRVTFAHCQFISDRDKNRMAQLDVSALVAPYWAVMDDYYWDVYLPLMSSQEKLDTQYPMQSLVQHGINLGFHSDYFVTKPDMGWLYYSAMTRVLPQKMYDLWYGDDEYYLRTTDTTVSQRPEDNQDRRLIGPLKAWDEVLTIDQTIQASTLGGARTLNLDDKIGTIEVGKSADIMILNKNLRTAQTEELENLQPIITFFEGEKLFVADDVPTAMQSVCAASVGNGQVRKIMSDGQVIIKSGASYYNTTGTRTIRNK